MAEEQKDFFHGLDIGIDEHGRTYPRATVAVAAVWSGLSRRRIHELCDEGHIRFSQPGKNRQGKKSGCKKTLDFRDVLEMSFGKEKAQKVLQELGMN